MKFPDFIIIGGARCGTTPLWFNVDKHPDITMAPKRLGKTEMHFWKKKFYEQEDIKRYKEKFKGKVCGEKTPGYYIRKHSMMYIKEYIPDVKLIMCVRNPVDRAYSNYRMNLKPGKVSGEFTYKLFEKRYSGAGKYMRHLKRNVLPLFDRDQLHICVTEHMKKDTVEEMNKIYDFLNLKRIYPERRVVDVNATFHKNIQENMILRRKESWYRVWDQYSTTVSGPLRKKMLEYYKPFNDELFKFLGYEIKEWKK